MTCVAWHKLLSDLIVGSIYPVFGEPTIVSVNDLSFLEFSIGLLEVAVIGLSSACVESGVVLVEESLVADYFLLHLTSCNSEPDLPGGKMAGVTWHVVFFKCSCRFLFSHFN